MKRKERDNTKPLESSSQTSKQSTANPSEKSKRICKFYDKGSCIHGISGENCNFAHPEVCRKFTQHGTRQPRGCKRGKKCHFFHPTMCIHSLRKGECKNQRCSYRHVQGTRRPLPNTSSNDNNMRTSAVTDKIANTGVIKHPAEEMSKNNQNDNKQQNHFLEIIRLLKAEFLTELQEMNAKIVDIKSQIEIKHPQKLETEPNLPTLPVQTLFHQPINNQANQQQFPQLQRREQLVPLAPQSINTQYLPRQPVSNANANPFRTNNATQVLQMPQFQLPQMIHQPQTHENHFQNTVMNQAC